MWDGHVGIGSTGGGGEGGGGGGGGEGEGDSEGDSEGCGVGVGAKNEPKPVTSARFAVRANVRIIGIVWTCTGERARVSQGEACSGQQRPAGSLRYARAAHRAMRA